MNRILSPITKDRTPDKFENFCLRILREQGYEVQGTPPSNDGGIDGIGHVKIGLLKFRVVIQCKKFSDPVDRPQIDKFLGAMVIHDVPRGIFMTSSKFTSEARKTAEKKDIDLIDFESIVNILEEKRIGIKEDIKLDNEFWSSYE